MIRHPENTNLTLCYDSTFLNYPIQDQHGPLIQEYLYKLHQTVSHALAQYPRVFAFRVDLHFPTTIPLQDPWLTNGVMDRFIESFKSKIAYNRSLARKERPGAHDSRVRYFWAKEFGQQSWPHYHLAILLNRDAFCALGYFELGRDNLFNRLVEAWASALSIPESMAMGLVEIPQNAMYHLCRDDNDGISDFIYRASYLCKAATKVYGDGSHGFGASRV